MFCLLNRIALICGRQLITEKFHRNPDVDSDRDIAVRTFDLATNQISVQFQYATDSITCNRRVYFKPPTPDYECEYLYSSDLTSAYKVRDYGSVLLNTVVV